MVFFGTHIGLFSIDVVYAMEPDSSICDAFMAKFNSVQVNVNHYNEQIHEVGEEFRKAVTIKGKLDPGNTSLIEKTDKLIETLRSYLKDTQANLSSKQRMLRIL
jgi:hypothetical protein